MAQSSTKRIRHTVVFKLKHPKGSPEEQDFLAAAHQLASIPGVEKFESLKQISQKNNFEWGLSIEFANQTVYDQYNHHPYHVDFVEQRWLKEVEDFLEIDYQL
ncbi:MAG: Dabb family protein [Anditalea sp.]